MRIKQFEVAGLAQYSYVISSQGQSIVIDPMRDFDRYTDYAKRQGLAITYVTETHIHADFASGAMALAGATGAELVLSAYDEEPYRYSMAHRPLHEGDVLRIGKLRLLPVHTPGHTPEHLSFVLFDDERTTSEPVAFFSGDFLFVGSLGRPDLLGAHAQSRLAHELYVSLHNRIKSLPDGVQVYPGHGAGSLCGAGMSERGESTLGYERAGQHLFMLDETKFVQHILHTVPPMPTYYPRMKTLNAEGASSFASVGAGRALSPVAVCTLLAESSATILDLRRPEAFGGAHIPRAINIGAGQNLSLWAGWLLSPEERLILVTDTGDDEEARRSLARVGLDQVVGFLENGMRAWLDAGLTFHRTTQASATETKKLAASTQILDVRSRNEWVNGHIEGARHIPLGQLRQQIGGIEKDTDLITVCGSGYRSSIAASILQAEGFTHVSSMNGGMAAWNRQQLPLISD
jgi:hydroxyacylglutathione hydrolase